MAQLVAGAGFVAADPLEVEIRPAPPEAAPLPAEQQQRINEAIDRGVAYLRRTQLKTGSWIPGVKNNPAATLGTQNYATGVAGLGGLTLLECGVPARDPAVQQAAAFVRQGISGSFRTYEVSLAILFLDRLGEPGDRALVRSLALRLAAGQTHLGGWGYNCPVLTPAQEQKLAESLRGMTREDLPKQFPIPPKGRSEQADNSNTQFAILALWAARKHDLPLDFTLARVEQRFRLNQSPAGWDYLCFSGRVRRTGAMTCVGLLGLAVGRGSAPEEPAPNPKAERPQPEDEGITWGLRALGAHMNDPTDPLATAAGPKGAPSLYFLWSVERVGVLCGVKTIGGRDWYRWGAELLLPAQKGDGSWVGRGSGGYPQVDTCFALLFLKRSDLLPDLRQALQKRLTITDPALDATAVPVKQSPGEKGNPKGVVPKKGPGDKGAPAAADDGLGVVDLGEVKAGERATLPLRVRGPSTFRITVVRGGDAQLQVEAGAQGGVVHDLVLTLRPEQAGGLARTIYLLTDLPGRAEVAVRLRARAVP